ncbi:MAG TPA: DMT family transporter [Paucimonas sp.]|nr:DMT family transporter [Paucimonas sp.]
MSGTNIARLFLLGAIWGSSFMLMRIAAPALGPLTTAFGRILLGGIALYLFARSRGIDFSWRRNGRIYLVIGVVNTAVPFALFAWAALHVPSAYSATMNAMAPVFTGMFGFLLLAERLTAARAAAFALGLIGVAVLVRIGPVPITAQVVLGILAGLSAAVCYGFAAVFTRMKAADIPPLATATGSQLSAALALLPFALPELPHAVAHGTPAAGLALAVLGIVCTGLAYALFFQLISAEGPGKAVMVTFLIPAAAAIWARLFLGEPITAGTVAGLIVVLCATALALGLFGQVKSLLRPAAVKP